MRKRIFALFALMLLSGGAFASINPKIQLINYSVSEAPAEPGHTVALTLQMKSMESDNCAERVAVQLAVSYPLSVRGPDTQYRESLCFRDPDSAGAFTFYLPVDNLATSGTYPITVATTYEKRFTKLSESNIVNLQVGGDPSFQASIASSNPVDIYPGDSAQVTVNFDNAGPSMVTSAHATASASGIEVKWAGRDQFIGSVSAHGSGKAVFNIEAPKSMEAGSYPLEIRLQYTSENKSQAYRDFTFMVPVKPKAEFSASSTDGDMIPGQKKEMALALSNTGTDEARKLQVRIKPLFPFSTDGTVRYVESLKPGETANLTYMITVDKEATAGGQLLGLQVDFEDAQGKKFSDSADFSMGVRSATIIDDIVNLWYVWALLALAGIFYFLRGKKKTASRVS